MTGGTEELVALGECWEELRRDTPGPAAAGDNVAPGSSRDTGDTSREDTAVRMGPNPYRYPSDTRLSPPCPRGRAVSPHPPAHPSTATAGRHPLLHFPPKITAPTVGSPRHFHPNTVLAHPAPGSPQRAWPHPTRLQPPQQQPRPWPCPLYRAAARCPLGPYLGVRGSLGAALSGTTRCTCKVLIGLGELYGVQSISTEGTWKTGGRKACMGNSGAHQQRCTGDKDVPAQTPLHQARCHQGCLGWGFAPTVLTSG